MTDKLDLVLDRIEDLKSSHGDRLDKIDENLGEHMKRTEMLEDRVEKLELPGKVLKFIKQSALWIGSILGVIMTVWKVFEIWSK